MGNFKTVSEQRSETTFTKTTGYVSYFRKRPSPSRSLNYGASASIAYGRSVYLVKLHATVPRMMTELGWLQRTSVPRQGTGRRCSINIQTTSREAFWLRTMANKHINEPEESNVQ